jgi:SAM-dependent methyltransferase
MSDKFIFNNQEYEYRRDDLQCQLGERIIEVPIFSKLISESLDKRFFEIGNVMKKYTPGLGWQVLDKHEPGVEIINEDICNPGLGSIMLHHAELIISVSTLEHIGFDMGESIEHGKIPKAFENIYSMLSPNGKFVFSVPVGYNPEIDWMLSGFQYISKFIGFRDTKLFFMERISEDNRWIQRDQMDLSFEYGKPFPYANFLVIGEMYK